MYQNPLCHVEREIARFRREQMNGSVAETQVMYEIRSISLSMLLPPVLLLIMTNITA
jgi:hypothetical protein